MKNIMIDILDLNNQPTGYAFEFKSSDHIRYQNGINITGHNYGCNRTIRIEKNINGNEGYSVTIINNDGTHPLWGNNIQMAPKQMKIVGCNEKHIFLRGFGHDIMGNSFADYGLTLEFDSNDIISCTLHMFDRNTDIKYLN